MKKRLWVIIGTIVMICIMMLCVYMDPGSRKMDLYSGVHFLVNGTDSINLWEDSEQNELIVFLPSYAEQDHTVIIIDDKTSVAIDGIQIISGTECSSFETGRKHTISVNGMPPKGLCFLKSENTASLFMDTSSGGIKFIHKEKDHKEDVIVSFYNAQGELDYSAEFKDKIRGRGNHSWWNYDKKSYNLYMNEPTNLLGLGAGTKWVLLSNTSDCTHIKNKLAMDFAREIGSYEDFSSTSTYVNLYMNGQYYGIYLLCRSVDDNLEHILGSNKDNNFSIELLPAERIESGKKTIQFNESMAVEIAYPDYISKDKKDRIENWVFSFDQFINSGNASADEMNAYIDPESWAEKYLVDAVFNDFDISYASNFYWGDTDNLRVYAGPCWDYDLSMGSHSTYSTFADEKTWRHGGAHDGITWNAGLWRIPEFREYAIQMYQDKFHEKLEKLIDTGIQEEADQIAAAMKLERRRWPDLYHSYENDQDAVDDLIDYMSRRITFLDSYWVNNDPYYVITLKYPYGNLRCYVSPNTIYEDLITPQDMSPEEPEAVWFYENTQEPFDYNTVIHEDITLVSKDYLNQINSKEETFTGVKIVALSLMAFLGILFVAWFIDYRRRRA